MDAPRPLATEPWQHILIGEARPSARFGHIFSLIGGRHSTVRITAETGTGEEIVARG